MLRPDPFIFLKINWFYW